jgi:2-polyprenyl-3-methyl-5-hydroxy-6-metoxy-1,4-benzoquinol methylase
MNPIEIKSMNPHTSTVAYYNHNQKRYFERTHSRVDQAALQEFCSRIPQGGKVLDAGCGTGRDLRVLNRLGFQSEGFDASSEMVTIARAQSGCKVWQADLMLLSLPKESYDAVWAHGVLSHLPAPGCQRAMASFFAALKPNGTLFVSITEGEGQSEDRTDDPSGPARTIYRYRADDFASLIRQSGFQVVVQGRNPARPELLAFIAKRI